MINDGKLHYIYTMSAGVGKFGFETDPDKGYRIHSDMLASSQFMMFWDQSTASFLFVQSYGGGFLPFNEAEAGADVYKRQALGAVTGANGQFLFAFPALDNVTLVFSFVGMKTKEIPYKGEKELNVVLEDEVTQMDEVVVTGIFNKAKESYTGAVKQLSLIHI